MVAIEARGIYHIYREVEVETVALRGADLVVDEGTWTSVMGPSGSGKSTLLQVMAGLLTPSGGQVFIGGEDLTRLGEEARARLRRDAIAYVGQRDNLHPLLTAGENVALPLRLAGESASSIRDRVAELLRRVGLTDRASHRMRQLSGGEAQRVSIAVALAPRPAVLLADEPTGELDETNTHSVLDLLESVRDDGTALVTVTHNPRVAERAEIRVGMHDGQVTDD